MKIIAFDQSTRASGWCYMEQGQYVCSGMIDMSKSKLETDARSFEMAQKLWEILDKYKPDHLILEETQQQTNVKIVQVLSRLQGMIIGYAEAHDIKTHIVQPAKWRAALHYTQGPKVKRAELKQQSMDYVQNNLGMELPEDQAESCCICIAAHKIFKFE